MKTTILIAGASAMLATSASAWTVNFSTTVSPDKTNPASVSKTVTLRTATSTIVVPNVTFTRTGSSPNFTYTFPVVTTAVPLSTVYRAEFTDGNGNTWSTPVFTTPASTTAFTQGTTTDNDFSGLATLNFEPTSTFNAGTLNLGGTLDIAGNFLDVGTIPTTTQAGFSLEYAPNTNSAGAVAAGTGTIKTIGRQTANEWTWETSGSATKAMVLKQNELRVNGNSVLTTANSSQFMSSTPASVTVAGPLTTQALTASGMANLNGGISTTSINATNLTLIKPAGNYWLESGTSAELSRIGARTLNIISGNFAGSYASSGRSGGTTGEWVGFESSADTPASDAVDTQVGGSIFLDVDDRTSPTNSHSGLWIHRYIDSWGNSPVPSSNQQMVFLRMNGTSHIRNLSIGDDIQDTTNALRITGATLLNGTLAASGMATLSGGLSTTAITASGVANLNGGLNANTAFINDRLTVGSNTQWTGQYSVVSGTNNLAAYNASYNAVFGSDNEVYNAAYNLVAGQANKVGWGYTATLGYGNSVCTAHGAAIGVNNTLGGYSAGGNGDYVLYSYAMGINNKITNPSGAATDWGDRPYGTMLLGEANESKKKHSTAVGYGNIARNNDSVTLGVGGGAVDPFDGDPVKAPVVTIGNGTPGGTLRNAIVIRKNNEIDFGTSQLVVGGSKLVSESRLVSNLNGTSELPNGFRIAATDANIQFAVGESTALGIYSTSLGLSNANGEWATAVGLSDANGEGATALGESIAAGTMSSALGGSTAQGQYSFAASAASALAESASALSGGKALGYASFAVGVGTVASYANQVALGRHNATMLQTDLLSVGDGTDAAHRKSVMTLTKSGTLSVAKVVITEPSSVIPSGPFARF